MGKKGIAIGRCIVGAILIYFALVTLVCVLLVEELSYMWPIIIVFLTGAIATSQPLAQLNTKIKGIVIVAAFFISLVIMMCLGPVSIGTVVGHFLAIIIIEIRLLFFLGILAVTLISALIIAIITIVGYATAPYSWYWW